MAHIVDDSRAVLEGFFSAPIAKAILGAAMKRAGNAGPEFQTAWYEGLFAELGRLLSVYLPDPSRRADCLGRLEGLHNVVRPRLPTSAGLRAPRVPRFAESSRSLTGPPRQGSDQNPSHASHPGRPAPVLRGGRMPEPSGGRSSQDRMRAQSAGATSTSVVVRDEIDVPNACEVARDLAKKLGFSVVDQTKMATAVSELARNMLQYAGGGHIRFAEVLAPRKGLEAFFEDRGPGIADLDGVLDPKYRSMTGMGMGLRGSKRIADEFLIDTQPGDGTRITMRKYVA